MSLNRVWMPSPNYSSRGGARVTTIVLHTAEGALTIESLANWFGNPANQVSSHVGIDDKPNTVGEYVDRDWKAWTAANANPWSVQAELCAFASWDPAEWDRHPAMLENTAAWIAEEASIFGIPLVLLSADQAQDPGCPGVCQHADLGAMGGGHWDCGPGFPIGRVLDMAAGGAGPAPEPETEDDMPLHLVIGDQSPEWWLTDWLTKRYVQTPDEAAQIIVSTIATGGKIEQDGSNGPAVYAQTTVDAVPRAD